MKKTILNYVDIPRKKLTKRGFDIYHVNPNIEMHRDFVRISVILVSKKELEE